MRKNSRIRSDKTEGDNSISLTIRKEPVCESRELNYHSTNDEPELSNGTLMLQLMLFIFYSDSASTAREPLSERQMENTCLHIRIPLPCHFRTWNYERKKNMFSEFINLF